MSQVSLYVREQSWYCHVDGFVSDWRHSVVQSCLLSRTRKTKVVVIVGSVSYVVSAWTSS